MANKNMITIDNLLERLEDSLNSPLSKRNTYQDVQNHLRIDANFSLEHLQRLLAVCIHDLKEDVQFAANALMVNSAILEILKTEKYPSKPDLLPSAEAILNLLKSVVQLPKTSALEQMCFDIMHSYPDNTLIALATLHSAVVLDIIKLYCAQNSVERKSLVFKFTRKILMVLPLDKRENFAKEGIAIWFTFIVPLVVKWSLTSNPDFTEHIEVVEMLADSLVNIDYAENPHWKTVFEHVYNPEKYPLVMKSLLQKGNDIWHRLWIIFIKLLKNQITKVCNTHGSPINAMLPVVELAFKMDTANRCRAFLCWNVLIDNFSTELNEAYLNKRIKLLITPLRSNNARVEETALAKLDTWWHLIRMFHNKIDNFTEMVFIPFLHFCFGKHANGKTTLSPGQFYTRAKIQSVQTLIEIVGHVNCEGCVTIPKLKSRIISIKLLIDYWNHWIHCLKTAIENLADYDDHELAMQQARCLWKAFITTIGELPENNVRKDLFNSILAIIEELLEKYRFASCVSSVTLKVVSIIFKVLITSLFSEQKFRQLLKVKDEDKRKEPLQIILSCLFKPPMNNFYISQDTKELISKLKPIAMFIMEEIPSSRDHVLEGLLKDMIPNDDTLMLWAAIAESMCESKHDMCVSTLCIMLTWPLKSSDKFSMNKSKETWHYWHILYNMVHPKLRKTIDTTIVNIMLERVYPSNIFLLCASISILKHKLTEENADFEKEAGILRRVLLGTKEDQQLEVACPMLVDTLVLMLNAVSESVNIAHAENAITSVKALFLFMAKILKSQGIDASSNMIRFIESLVQPLHALFKIEQYYNLGVTISVELIQLFHLLNENTALKKNILSILKTFLSISKKGEPLYNQTKSAIDAFENKIESGKQNSVNQDLQNNFPIPEVTVTKKPKKKEASIVNTVVENGEEYVVVKSNWKFNPRKLTENQKEKFKRKREDIPALYQDLSQSQDEFKLATWKPDSQDTSTTSSRSTSKSANDDASMILKNMPSTNVVPTIMENNFSENVNIEKSSEKIINDNSTNKPASPALKDTKSPRLALKDRVFRNVRNLIEKSGKQNDGKLISEDLNQTVNDIVTKTPLTKAKNIVNVINSAPPKISSERPSRVIKKPKKFDDSEIFAIKKRRRSQNDSQPDIETPEDPVKKTNVQIEAVKDDPKCPVNEEYPEPALTSNETENVECPKASGTDACNTEVIDLIENSEVPQPVEKINDDVTIVSDSEKRNDLEDRDKCSGLIASGEKSEQINVSSDSCTSTEITTPKANKNNELDETSVKKKRSRIEKQLLIDMVEGHPFLQVQSEKRVTRKNILSPVNTPRRKSLADKLDKLRSDPNVTPKAYKKTKEKETKEKSSTNIKSPPESVTSIESSEDIPMSEDIIESSQDSTITTISVKSTKSVHKKIPVVVLNKAALGNNDYYGSTENLLKDLNNDTVPLPSNQENKDDIDLPKNDIIAEEKTEMDSTENMDTEPINSTENMDTEPMEQKDSSSDVIIISNDVVAPIVINTENTDIITHSDETIEIAEADTQPMDIDSQTINAVNKKETKISVTQKEILNDVSIITIDTQEDATKTISETIDLSAIENVESTDVGSPFKDEAQRKKDFLNDTVEISPIKTLSPVRNSKSPSPETSSDYVIIKLASPVQSNGEPYDKCDSPEIFTDDKVSPDKRDQSPPRGEVVVKNTSPSSSLSLKKNRSQVRSTCRGAHMLSLCCEPDKLQAIMNSERVADPDEPKKNQLNTSARRKLRISYSSLGDNEKSSESDSSENFLKFKKALPTADCSPAGPILKRKLIDITDEATVSPANKRKRVSFHDPPVSTTVAVQKYIEPGVVRSPQSSALKRQERQMRAHANMKSPKRLDTAFKLDTVLNKALESFSGETSVVSNDTVSSSLDQTPAVEVIKTSDLNDTDPICPDLLDCNDPIDNIAGELSSPAMKALLIKELTGKVETIADLAKMTELEVNRLCIKAPKVTIVKKVLTDYASKTAACLKKKEKIAKLLSSPAMNTSLTKGLTAEVDTIANLTNITEPEVKRSRKANIAEKVLTDSASKKAAKIQESNDRFFERSSEVVKEPAPEIPVISKVNVEIQTNEVLLVNSEMQTVVQTSAVHTQTVLLPTTHISAQTDESGVKSTKDLISSCLKDRPDFIEKLSEQLEESSVKQIADNLSFNASADLLMKKMTASNAMDILNRVLDKQCNIDSNSNGTADMSFLQDYLCKRLDSKDLILFCSQLLLKLHDKPA